jgi:kynurenine 3-monooxygenase
MKEVAFMESGVVAGSTRGLVVQTLLREALATAAAGGKIAFRLGLKLVDVDLGGEKLTFNDVRDESHAPIVIDTSDARVIDTSGCWSKIRAAFAAADPTFVVETYPWRTAFRNLFTAPNVAVPKELDPKAHHIFSTANMFASELVDGKWVFVVSSNEDDPSTSWLREREPTPANVARLKAFVYEHCPVAPQMLSDDEEFARFFTRRTFSGQVVRVSRLNWAEKFVIMGDAAHSVIPATGEGVNSALEDVRILVETRKASGKDGWFAHFDGARLADVRALGEYAAWLVQGLRAGESERTVRTATTVLTAIFKKMSLAGPTIADQCYGQYSKERRPYSKIVADWKAQQSNVRPLAAAVSWLPNLLFSKN